MLGVLGTLFFVCAFFMAFWVLIMFFGFLPYWIGKDMGDKLKNFGTKKVAETTEAPATEE